MEKKIKTAEEILSKHTGLKVIYITHGTLSGYEAIDAMEEYANQFNSTEREAEHGEQLKYAIEKSFKNGYNTLILNGRSSSHS
jgi:hypothetical protein